jgi:hypothetical protein
VAVTVLVCDSVRTALTSPVPFTSLTVEIKFNAVGTGEFVAPLDAGLVGALETPESTVLVIRDGAVFAGGPVEKPGGLSWTPDQGDGTVKVNFGTWEAYLGRRLTYPDPGLASTAQVSASWAAVSTNAELVLRDLVDLNAGVGALADRSIPGLALGALASVGTSIDLTTRFEPLLDTLRKAATAGGGLGFRIVTDATLLRFEVYQPTDRSGSVRFSRSLRNLQSLTTDPENPAATVALVGGDGTGAARDIVECSNTTALSAGWWRSETWVNQASTATTATEMAQAGSAALAEKGPKTGVACVAVDGPQGSYAVDYWIGDQVSVEPTPGVSIVDVVTSVKLTSDPTKGDLLVAVVGSGARTTTRQLQLLLDVERRLARTERG